MCDWLIFELFCWTASPKVFFFLLSWLKYPCPIQLSNYFSFAIWDADKWEGASVYICIYSDSWMVETLDKMQYLYWSGTYFSAGFVAFWGMWKCQGRCEESGGEWSCVGSQESAFRGQIWLYSAALHIFPHSYVVSWSLPKFAEVNILFLTRKCLFAFCSYNKTESFSDVSV